MQIFYSPSSPFVRKVMVLASELGITEKIAHLDSAVHPVKRDQRVVAENPLGQVPTLLTDDGLALYDSRVICEYLDSTYGNGRLFPQDPTLRWPALRDQARADGLINAGLLVRYEITLRTQEQRHENWINGQMQKITSSLAEIESHVDSFGERFDIGVISTVCALGYIDFRFPELEWRNAYPHAARWFAPIYNRSSFQQTAPSLKK